MNYTQEQITEMGRIIATSAIETIAKFRNATIGEVWQALLSGDPKTVAEFALLSHRGVGSVVRWSAEADNASVANLPAYLRAHGGR